MADDWQQPRTQSSHQPPVDEGVDPRTEQEWEHQTAYDDEVYEDHGGGLPSWIWVVAGLIIFNVLSYVFDWGFILY